MLEVEKTVKSVLTHHITPSGPMPAVLDPDGVYPYQSYCETSARPEIKEYTFIRLENDLLIVLICPDLGGKVYSIIHKESDREVLYVPKVIRQSRILPRFSFVAGGIEVSFPISHTPSQNEKVTFDICETRDRIYVSVGETELRYGMQWTVEFSLGEKDSFLVQRTVFNNPTELSHPWMSWSNAAVPACEDSILHFPNGPVMAHSDQISIIDWEKEGPKTIADIDAMAGYFWRDPDCCAFGCFTPSLGTGLYHVADIEKVKGIKLWSYGAKRDLEWSYLSSLNKQAYLEIQAGPIADQSIKYELAPNEKRHHIEFWIPSIKPLNIHEMKVPELELRSLDDIPLFSYARAGEVEIWDQLQNAFKINATERIPRPPNWNDATWPPGGMHVLAPAFKWAIENDSVNEDYWYLHFGVWLLARGEVEQAMPMLTSSHFDLAKALLARVYLVQGNPKEAVQAYEQMTDDVLVLHPQIAVERDKALAALGETSNHARLEWLEKLNALEDEMIVERYIDLLIDMKKYEEAKQLFCTTKFQKIHQRYERQKLWDKLKKYIDLGPYPDNLGEDNLAPFGAYRDFEEKE